MSFTPIAVKVDVSHEGSVDLIGSSIDFLSSLSSQHVDGAKGLGRRIIPTIRRSRIIHPLVTLIGKKTLGREEIFAECRDQGQGWLPANCYFFARFNCGFSRDRISGDAAFFGGAILSRDPSPQNVVLLFQPFSRTNSRTLLFLSEIH